MKSKHFKSQAMVQIIPLLLAIFIFTSCGEGDVGPAGPAGPQGAPGPKGDNGDAANVITSGWLEYDLKSGIYASLYYAKITVPEITQEILDKGVIRVYVKTATTIYDIPNPSFEGFYARYSVGTLEIFSPTEWDTYSGYSVRYVLIPPSE